MTAISILTLIKNTQGTKNKEQILETHSKNLGLLELLTLAFNPYLTFGINTIPYTPNIKATDDKLTEFIKLAYDFSAKDINNADLLMYRIFLESIPSETAEIYVAITSKSLTLGIAAKSINKVIPNHIQTFECMLADSGEIESGTQYLVQEKLDGVRCIFIKKDGVVTAFTRQGNRIPLKKIPDILAEFPNDNIVLDGELLMSGELRKVTSGKINSLMKSGYQKEIDDKIEVYLFDYMTLEEWVSKQSLLPAFSRTMEVVGISDMLGAPFMRIKQILTDSELEIKEFYEEIRKNGGEGLILKKNTPYEWKRSKNWLKLKAICSCTLEIIGFIEGKGKNKGKVGAVTCQSSDSVVVVNVNPRTDAERDWFTESQNKLDRIKVEVLFNELIEAEDGSFSLFLPRFDINAVRFDKFKADSYEDILREVGSNIASST